MNGEAKKQAIWERLRALEEKHGTLTVDAVVTEAKKKTSPLHGEFQWDDEKAAHEYRKEQARKLIQGYQFHVEVREGVIAAPAYVRDPDAENGAQGYRSTASIRTDRDRAMATLVSEVGRASAHLQRVHNIAAALDLSGELDEVMSRFEVFRSKVVC